MSKKDFELIAQTIKSLRLEPACESNTLDAVAREFAHNLRTTNSRFNVDRFLRATQA
jgi:hypothetical protein